MCVFFFFWTSFFVGWIRFLVFAWIFDEFFGHFFLGGGWVVVVRFS